MSIASKKPDLGGTLDKMKGASRYTKGWGKKTQETTAELIMVTTYLPVDLNAKIDRVLAYRKEHEQNRKLKRWQIIADAVEKLFREPEYTNI